MDVIGDKSIEKYDGLSTIFYLWYGIIYLKSITDNGYGIKNLRLPYEGSTARWKKAHREALTVRLEAIKL